MTIKNENKFKDIIGELKGLNRISAEEGLKENILKLSKPTLKEDYQVFDSNEEAITPSQTPTLSEDKANIDEENIDKEIASDSSDKKNGQKDSNQDIKGISAENQEHAETAIQNALLVVPN